MFKKPVKPEEVYEDFSSDTESIFGSNLLSIYLYGSGARGEYIQGKSDINFLVVIKSEGLKYLSGVWEHLDKWEKRAISAPLILTESYLSSSLDAFPLEFHNMKEANELIFGEDLLDNININDKDLRVQVEHELKAKLLSLRQGFMITKGDRNELIDLISLSLPTFSAIFRGTLFLKQIEYKGANSSELYERVEETFEVRKGLFLDLLNIKFGIGKWTTSQLIELMEEYMATIRIIFRNVDKL